MTSLFLALLLGTGSGPPPGSGDWFEHEHHAWISGGALASTDDGGAVGGELSLTWWPDGMGLGQWGALTENLAEGGWGLGLWAQGEYLLDGLHRARYGAGLEFMLTFLGVEVGTAIVDPTATLGRTAFVQLTPFYSVSGIFCVGGRFSLPIASLDAGRTAQPFEVGAVFSLKLPIALDEGGEAPDLGRSTRDVKVPQ